MSHTSLRALEHHDAFLERHIGPNDAEIAHMLRAIGHDSLEALTDAIVPGSIKSGNPLALPAPITAFSPMVMPQSNVAPEPMDAPRATNVGTQVQSASVCNCPEPFVARG